PSSGTASSTSSRFRRARSSRARSTATACGCSRSTAGLCCRAALARRARPAARPKGSNTEVRRLLPRDLPPRLLEHLVRLAAGDQVFAIDDDGRHAVDAELLPEPLGLANLLRVLAAL